MKISGDKKNEIRKKLLESCVEIMTEKGFSRATMREIATHAGVGGATIYNYFPTKEAIFHACLTARLDELDRRLDHIPDFPSYTLKEKLQIQMETLLDIYLADREFIAGAWQIIMSSPFSSAGAFGNLRDRFGHKAGEFITGAADGGEIPPQVALNVVTRLYGDYTGMILGYWLKDDSEGFNHTSQMIDKSLDIFVEVLRSGIIVKFTDFMLFLFRSHLADGMKGLAGILAAGKSAAGFFTGAGRTSP